MRPTPASKCLKEHDLRICTWNLRTFYRVGESVQMVNALKIYRAYIIALQDNDGKAWTVVKCSSKIEKRTRTPRQKDVKIVISDFNIKVGREDIFKHDNSSDNGLRLFLFATLRSMIINSTGLQHLNIHRTTQMYLDQ